MSDGNPVEAAVGATLAAVERLPASAASRSVVAADSAPSHQLASVIEGDPALAMAILRLANRRPNAEAADSVASAVASVPRATIAALAKSSPFHDLLDPQPPWGTLPASFRRHALTVRAMTEQLSGEIELDRADVLGTAALLHDVGKLGMAQLLAGRADQAKAHDELADAARATPQVRLAREREAFGFDHAQLGGAIARAWNFPDVLVMLVESHHTAFEGDAALLRVADMLAHYAHDRPVDLAELVEAATGAGISRDELRRQLYELPGPVRGTRRRAPDSPLSPREVEVLRCVGQGMSAKEVAAALGVSASTVRNHLYRVYTRIGVHDRTQAILAARDRGWI